MKKIKCFLISIKDLFKYRIWIRHSFINPVMTRGIVIATNKNFRISDSLVHTNKEKVYEDAYIETSYCKYCGKKNVSWAEFEF